MALKIERPTVVWVGTIDGLQDKNFRVVINTELEFKTEQRSDDALGNEAWGSVGDLMRDHIMATFARHLLEQLILTQQQLKKVTDERGTRSDNDRDSIRRDTLDAAAADGRPSSEAARNP